MDRNSKVIKKSYDDTIFNIINYGLLSVALIVTLYPLIFVVSASISSPSAVWGGEVWLLPKGANFKGYALLLEYKTIWIGYRNTIVYTVLGTAINLFLTITAAYPLSRKDFYARNFLMAIYTFTVFFSGGLIPTYLLVKQLGMLDTIWAMVIPGAIGVYNVIISRTYFQSTISEELRDAAVIDGFTNTKFLLKVVIPLSAPIISVMVLFHAVGHWNAFFNAYIYLSDRMKYPLQVFLREMLIKTQVDRSMLGLNLEEVYESRQRVETLKYAVIIASSLPVLMVYPFIQRHFVKGVMIGSLKG